MDSEDGVKAQPDVGPLNTEESSNAAAKVELDLEDAPFLQEDALPKPAGQPLPAEEPKPGSGNDDEENSDETAGAKRKKKLFIVIGGGVLSALAASAAVWWFLLRTPPPPPVVVEPEIIKIPSPPATAVPTEYVIDFEPFLVELPDGKGGVVFLAAKFAAITRAERLVGETRNKMPLLRDAVFYYLRNKPYKFLVSPENAPAIKQDINSVLSGYLAAGKIDDILFESYLGK